MAPALLKFYGGSPASWASTSWLEAVQHYRAIPGVVAMLGGLAPRPPHMGEDLDTVIDKIRGSFSDKKAVKPPVAAKSLEELKNLASIMGLGVDIR